MSDPTTAPGYSFRAFISYNHKDQGWARWLMRELESYRVPRDLAGRPRGNGQSIERRLGKFFRDRDESSASDDLAKTVRTALESSEHLIVVASPASARSAYVNREIREFAELNSKRAGRGHILALIVGGEPNATDPAQECLPPALRELKGDDGSSIEPLAADARPTGDGKTRALAKLVAGLLDVRYDALVRRDLRRRRRLQAAIASAACAIGAIAVSVVWKFEADRREREELDQARARAEREQRTVAAVSAAERAKSLLAAGKGDEAVRLARQSLPDDGTLPFIPQAYETLYAAHMSGGAPISLEIAGMTDSLSATLPLATGMFLTWTNSGETRLWSPGGGVSYATDFGRQSKYRKPIRTPGGDAAFIPRDNDVIRYRTAARAWEEIEISTVELQGAKPDALLAINASTLLGCGGSKLFEFRLPTEGSGAAEVAWQTEATFPGPSCDNIAAGADGTIYVAAQGTIVAVDPQTRKEVRRYKGTSWLSGGLTVQGDRLEISGIGKSLIFHLQTHEPPLELANPGLASLLGPGGRYAVSADGTAAELIVHDLSSGTKTTAKCPTCKVIGFVGDSLLVLEENRVVRRNLPAAEPIATVHEFLEKVDDTHLIPGSDLLIGIRKLQPETIVRLGESPRGILADPGNRGSSSLRSATFLRDDAVVLVEFELTSDSRSISGRSTARVIPARQGGGKPLWEADIGAGPTGYGDVVALGHDLIAVIRPDSMMSWPATVEVVAPLDHASILKRRVLSDIAIDASRKHLVMDGEDGIAIVDLVGRKSEAVTHGASDWRVAGERLLAPDRDGTIKVRRLAADRDVATDKKLTLRGSPEAICVAPDDDTLFALTASKEEGFVERWSLAAAKRIALVTIDPKTSMDVVEELAFFTSFDRAMRFSRIRCTRDSIEIDGSDKRVLWSSSGAVKLVPKVDVAELPLERDAHRPPPPLEAVRTAKLVTVNDVTALRGLDGKWLFSTPKQESRVATSKLLPKRGWLAIGLENGRLRVWDLAAFSAPMIDVPAHQSGIATLDVNPAESMLVTADHRGQVRLWPMLTATELLARSSPQGPSDTLTRKVQNSKTK